MTEKEIAKLELKIRQGIADTGKGSNPQYYRGQLDLFLKLKKHIIVTNT